MVVRKEHSRFCFLDMEANISYKTFFDLFQSDIMDVNQIFKDLAVMIHDQGEMIGE